MLRNQKTLYLLKGANREIINIVGKQEELLKKFKESDEFFSSVDLSWSNIYFKMRLNKFLCISYTEKINSYLELFSK